MRSILGLMATIFLCDQLAGAPVDGDPSFLGTWVASVDTPNPPVLRITRSTIDLGFSGCLGMRYQLVEQFPSTDSNDYYGIEVIGDPDKCRTPDAGHMVIALRVSRSTPPSLNTYYCPTLEELQLLMHDGNYHCMGEFHWLLQTKVGE